METSNKTNSIIRYDHDFILALRESPLVGTPDDFDSSFIEIYTDRRKKMYRNDGSNSDMLPSPSLNDRSSIVLGPPKISFASSKQAIKTKFDEEQSRYMMSSRRVIKQNSDERSKNMYRNRYQRNMRDRSDSFEHNNLVSPTTGQMHGHNYQNYDKNTYENNRNSNEKAWKYNHQKDKSFENDEENGQHSNNSLNGENRKRNQFQQDKYNNNIEDHKRNRDRMMKFDKDKYSLRMPNNEMRDRSQNKREDGSRYSFKSPGLASAPISKNDYHSYNRKQDEVPEWMNYSPLDDAKLGTNDKKKVDDFQIFKAKMNNRQGLSSLSKTSQYNERESFFDEVEKNRNLRNELNELQNKKEFFDIDQSDKVFNSVDQYFTNSLENNNSEQLPSIFTNNIGYSMDNSDNKKSADSTVGGSKFSRFFSSSNDNVPDVGGSEMTPPHHIQNFDIQTMQNSMVSASLLESSTSLLNKNNNTINSPLQQNNPSINLPPPPGNFTNIPESNINNISNNSSTTNLHKNEDTSIIDSFISKYSIPPEKIVNNTNPPPLPLSSQLPINLQQQISSPNMLNQPGEFSMNLANSLQQPLPQNIPPMNFNNQLPFNQLPLNLSNTLLQTKPSPSEKKIYSEEDILKSMGITKTESENHEKTEKDIEQDKESMNRVMDLLVKSMNAKLATNDSNNQVMNLNESIQSPTGKPIYINSPSGPVPLNNDQINDLQSPVLVKQNKNNNDSRKQSESNISNKINENQKSKKNSFSNKQSSSQILQNLVQHTIDSKLGGNMINDNKNSIHDDELDEIEPTKPIIKNEPMKNQVPIMEMNNVNNNMNINNLPFNQGMNNPNVINQLPMMGFNNNMYDQFSMNKEEMLPPQFMQQRPPIPMMQQGQNFMDSPQPNPNMFLQFNQNLPPQLQFPPQFQNEQQSFSIHQGIYPGMISNMANQQSQQQMLMENIMNRRSIPISMMLSENIGNSPTQYITVEELERQQMK
eukprot:jgi/Orpsp1_1/1188187/evm.model.d7180000063076.1